MADNNDNNNEVMLEDLLVESSKEAQAKAFMHELEQTNPKLYAELEHQALLAIQSIRNGYKPAERLETLKHLFQMHPSLDPTASGDTYGVRAFITAMTKNKREAGRAKRFYDRAIDAFFKSLYNDSPYLPSKVAGYDPEKLEKQQKNVIKPKKTKISTVKPEGYSPRVSLGSVLYESDGVVEDTASFLDYWASKFRDELVGSVYGKTYRLMKIESPEKDTRVLTFNNFNDKFTMKVKLTLTSSLALTDVGLRMVLDAHQTYYIGGVSKIQHPGLGDDVLETVESTVKEVMTQLSRSLENKLGGSKSSELLPLV